MLVVSLDSDVAVDVRIARESDYRRWCNGEDAEVYEEKEGAYECTLTFVVPTDNRYVVWISKEEDQDAVVEVDTVIWNADENGDEEEGDDEDE